MPETAPEPALVYNDPHDTLELVACELAKILGVLVGIGATPFLRARLARFGLVEIGVGAFVVLIGLIFWFRRLRRERPGLFQGLRALAGRLLAGLRRAWSWVQDHLPGRRRNSGSEVREAITPARPGEPSPVRPVVLLPYLTILIGIFILAPAAVVYSLRDDPIPDLDLIVLYFSAPAILIWAIGELPYFFSKAVVRPKNASVYAGISKSVLQVLSAILFWIFLGLAIGMEEFTWMLVAAFILALLGLILGLVSEAGERRRLQIQPQDIE